MDVSPPRLAKELNVLGHLKELMQSDETLSSAILRNEDINNLRIKSFNANELRLERVNATKAGLERAGFADVELINCILIATAMPESSWRRVLVKNSRCSGLQLQTSTLKDVTFTDCKLNLANFRFSKLKNVRFKDCILDEADFYSAELERVDFENCSLDKTEFSSSKLKHVDLRTSEIVNIAGISSLSGVTIDSIQLIALAPLLASELRIEVRDD